MSSVDDFLSQFDEHGQYRAVDGELDVVFSTKSGGQYPGKLVFKNGLCIRAEMDQGGDWSFPDGSPLNEFRILLHFAGQNPHAILIDEGKIIHHFDVHEPSTKEEFLKNFRVARNLFFHPQVEADSRNIDTDAITRTLARAAIWLTPKSVSGFNADDFPELGLDRQRELQSAIRDFELIAEQVPANKPASAEQYGNAIVAFKKVLDILAPYLAMAEEAQAVEHALREVIFPPWVLNWDYELGGDSDGASAVWVNVFVDEKHAPLKQMGKFASEFTTQVRIALTKEGVDRWPYIRMRTASEHKSQV